MSIVISLLWLWLWSGAGLRIDVATWGGCGVVTLWRGVGGERLVGKVGVGVFRDDVPSMDETRKL